MQKKADVLKILTDMARYYGQDLHARQLEMYVDVLRQFDPNEFYEATRLYMADPNNSKFPIPPHSIMAKRGGGDEAISKAAAARIIEAVKDHGYSNPMEARAYIGELGWRAVKSFGGWSYVCENLGKGLSVTSVMAQARELCKTNLELSRKGLLDLAPGLPEPVSGKRDQLPNELKTLGSLKTIPKEEK